MLRPLLICFSLFSLQLVSTAVAYLVQKCLSLKPLPRFLLLDLFAPYHLVHYLIFPTFTLESMVLVGYAPHRFPPSDGPKAFRTLAPRLNPQSPTMHWKKNWQMRGLPPRRSKCVRPFAPEMEHICGRPLGLRFDRKTGDLYIGDAYLGLQVVGSSGGVATKLVTEVEGKPLLFTNDMDIDEQGDVIYFTDTSRTFQRRQFVTSVISEDKTGRLLKYNRSTNEVSVLLQGIAFANGVALSKDRSFVLIAETTSCKIIRFWLQGPDAGKHETFAELPGFPDNIRMNSKGEFWVALHSKRGTLAKWLISSSWAGKALLNLGISSKKLHYLITGGKPHATAIKLSKKGEVLKVLEDCDGQIVKFISEAEERNGKLWMGSVLMPYIVVYKL